jgi:hypothetical protein
MAEPTFSIELTAQEAQLLSDAASARANEFTRSIAAVTGADERLRAAWMHNVGSLRDLATRLAQLKGNQPNA